MIGWWLRSLAKHRDLLWQMVATDIRGRYVGSSLGIFWTVIHPLVMILIYTVVFSHLMSAKLAGHPDPYAYGVYLCSALLPWSAFQEIVARATTIFPDNAALVRKVAFPKAILYGVLTLSCVINLGLAAGVFVLVMGATGHAPHATLLLWLFFAAVQIVFGLGVGMIASVIHVFVRDTAQLVTVFFQVLFWATPIVYVEEILPPWLRSLETLNPMYRFACIHRAVMLDGTVPTARGTAVLLVLTAVTLALGTVMYRRFRSDILDEL